MTVAAPNLAGKILHSIDFAASGLNEEAYTDAEVICWKRTLETSTQRRGENLSDNLSTSFLVYVLFFISAVCFIWVGLK